VPNGGKKGNLKRRSEMSKKKSAAENSSKISNREKFSFTSQRLYRMMLNKKRRMPNKVDETFHIISSQGSFFLLAFPAIFILLSHSLISTPSLFQNS
jgi:hypothetical protein